MNFIIKNETPDFFEKLYEELDKSFSNCLIENWKVIKNLFKVTPKTNIHIIKDKKGWKLIFYRDKNNEYRKY